MGLGLGGIPIHWVCTAAMVVSAAYATDPPPIQPPDRPIAPILPMDDIRVGMKGYGLTVFQGTRIEPFRVEVVSVMRQFTPGHGVIWVRCPEPRMQKLGPVQGMSGSPIYLWPEGDTTDHQPGQGGRLIGALALGFSGTKDCYVGIQPIEQMRQVGERATPDEAEQPAQQHGGQGQDVLGGLVRLIAHHRAQGRQAWRAEAALRLAIPPGQLTAQPATGPRMSEQDLWSPPWLTGQALGLKLPIVVGSTVAAQALAEALEPLGMLPVAAATRAGGPPDGAAVSIPPSWIDPEAIRLEPGSVLSVPLAFGDMDLSAVGTVTEVQPDGRVLAFGHGLLSQGPIAVPMATGYIHFIMPSLASSFKLGGSGVIRGAIVRDENSAVVGIPGGQFDTAPVDVAVHAVTGPPAVRYHYQVVHHRRLTPFITATVVLQSITARSNLPVENTVRLHGTIRFTGNRMLNLDSTLINTSASDVLLELLPLIATMMQNPHDSMALESAQLMADIEPVARSGSIVNARIDQAEIAPGDPIGITVQIQPYGQTTVKRHIKLPTPEGLEDGDYDLIVCDAQTYLQLLFENRPHLLATSSVDEFRDILQRVLGTASDAVYAILQLPDGGLAIGRQELPRLPSSRRALYDTPTSTMATPYVDWVEHVEPTEWVLTGRTQFSIRIRKALSQ